LVVFDLAGTTVDFGSRAPLAAFVELFRRHGVALGEAAARGPMGMHKRDHIAALLEVPAIRDQWREANGNLPEDADIQRLYEEFQPIQISLLPQHAELVPGVLETVEQLRSMDCRIAATTGYSREMTDIVLREAARQGFVPDVCISGSEVPEGRPAPWLAQACARELGVYPMAASVKIGDTIVDVESGINAGMWSLGVAATGNMVGLSLAEYEALGPAEREERLATARHALHAVGAVEVLDSVAELPAWVEEHNTRQTQRS
jgi:phosphonoacetaldehyde hydrolase